MPSKVNFCAFSPNSNRRPAPHFLSLHLNAANPAIIGSGAEGKADHR